MKNKKMLVPVSLILSVLMLCACGKTVPQGTSVPTTQPQAVETTAAPTIPTFEEVENPVKSLYISMGPDYENVQYMNVMANEDGSAHVEYVGEEKKVGDFDANVFHGMAAAFKESGLEKLNGQDVYDQGDANGSMYVEFADGSMSAVGFSGKIPEAFSQGFTVMDEFFRELTAGLPVYVPQPVVMGEVSEDLLKETLDILQGSGIEALDSFTVMQIPMDEYFAYAAGLTSAEGIRDAVSVSPMMMTTAYSMVIVSLEDAGKAEAIGADFEKNMDWTKWVCVAPASAVLAQKDNMVLFLMTYEALDAGTPEGIRQAGWTEVKTFTNPNMQ